MCKKCKVVLINPGLPQNPTQFNFPNNLLYLGTWLSEKAGYKIDILDFYNRGEDEDNRLRMALGDDVLAVGFGVMTAQVKSAVDLAGRVRRIRPDLPILWGGVQPTLYPEQVAESPLSDYVVTGEGELATVDLLNKLATGERPEGKVIVGEPVDINELPTPDFWLLDEVRRVGDLRDVMRLSMKGMPLLTSFGCPHRCAFCINSVTSKKYRFRDAELVVDDVQKYLAQGLDKILFIDEDFLANKPRLITILDGIGEHKLKFQWFGTARADYFTAKKLSPEILERLKNSGCWQIGIGMESGSQRVLDMICKDITLEDSRRAAEWLNNSGIDATFSFMFGLPDETEEEINDTMKFITELTAVNNRFRILPNLYRPYAGSKLYDRCLELGMRKPEKLEDWIDNPYMDNEPAEKDYGLFPWVQYPMKKMMKLLFYTWLSGVMIRYGVTRILRKLGNWRCRHHIFLFPFELWAYNLVVKLHVESRFGRGKFNG